MTAPRIRVVWRSDHDVPGNQAGRLTCPRCPDLDVIVTTHQAAASAIAGHIALHAGRDRKDHT